MCGGDDEGMMESDGRDPDRRHAGTLPSQTRLDRTRAANDPSVFSVFTITEKAPTNAFSWLKAPTIAFTFNTLC